MNATQKSLLQQAQEQLADRYAKDMAALRAAAGQVAECEAIAESLQEIIGCTIHPLVVTNFGRVTTLINVTCFTNTAENNLHCRLQAEGLRIGEKISADDFSTMWHLDDMQTQLVISYANTIRSELKEAA